MQAELFANARDFTRARAVIGPLMTPVYPEEVRNAALSLCEAVSAQRAGLLVAAGQGLREPRPK